MTEVGAMVLTQVMAPNTAARPLSIGTTSVPTGTDNLISK